VAPFTATRILREKCQRPVIPFLGNTPPSATSLSPLQEMRAAWRERIAAPYTEDCPISGASRSPPRRHGGNAGVRGPHCPSARARAVGPSEPACAVSAGGASPVLFVEVRQPLAAHRARDAEDVFVVCKSSRAAEGTDAKPTRCCIRAQSALAGRYILTIRQKSPLRV